MMESTQITFLCTDRGSHPPRRLGPVEDWSDTLPAAAELLTAFGFDGQADTAGEAVHRPAPDRQRITHAGDQVTTRHASMRRLDGKRGPVWEFTCPSCGRNPRIREDVLARLVQAAKMGAVNELDVSRMPV